MGSTSENKGRQDVSRNFFFGMCFTQEFFGGREGVYKTNLKKRKKNTFISIFVTFLRVRQTIPGGSNPITPLDTVLREGIRMREGTKDNKASHSSQLKQTSFYSLSEPSWTSNGVVEKN